MNIEQRRIGELRPYSRNARTHSRKQIRQIAKSIERFGFCNPVLVDDVGQIIAGHGRVEAAKLLNIQELPTVRLSHLSDDDKRAYLLADNQTGRSTKSHRDFRLRRLKTYQIQNTETPRQDKKPTNGGLSCDIEKKITRDRTWWLAQ